VLKVLENVRIMVYCKVIDGCAVSGQSMLCGAVVLRSHRFRADGLGKV
jgi:hypothetical protein